MFYWLKTVKLPYAVSILLHLFFLIFVCISLNLLSVSALLYAAETQNTTAQTYRTNVSLDNFNRIMSDLGNGLFPSDVGGILTSYRISNTILADDIVITNAKLQECLQKQFGHTPSQTELQAMTRFTCRGLVNSDITELSGLTQLNNLDLSSNKISDISALSGLTQLNILYLSSNKISDINALSGLTQLNFLNLGRNQINDINALSGLTQLNFLNLIGNKISDISALSGLTQLNYLYLSSNKISDISALSGLTQLNYLDINSNQISDISALSGLTQLNYLRLWNNQISDISPLAPLIELNNPSPIVTFRLELSGNCIRDFSAISHLTHVGGKENQNQNCTQIAARYTPQASLAARTPLKNALEPARQALIIPIRDVSGTIINDNNRYRIVRFDANSSLGGSISNEGQLSFNYNAPTDWLESDHFNYSLYDQNSNISSDVTVNIVPIVTNDDQVSLSTDTAVTIRVLANDLNLTGSDIAIHAFDDVSAQGGTITGDSKGLIYTPKLGFSGTDSFTYKIQTASAYLPSEAILIDNVLRAANTATVRLTVQTSTVENVSLVANNDEVSLNEGENISLNVLNNDISADTITLTHTDPQNGTLENKGAGNFSYRPKADFIGVDSFTYTLTDGNGVSATATVKININGAGGAATVGAGSMGITALWLLLLLYLAHLIRQASVFPLKRKSTV